LDYVVIVEDRNFFLLWLIRLLLVILSRIIPIKITKNLLLTVEKTYGWIIRISSARKKFTIKNIDTGGHHVHMTQPKDVAQTIAEWLDKQKD